MPIITALRVQTGGEDQVSLYLDDEFAFDLPLTLRGWIAYRAGVVRARDQGFGQQEQGTGLLTTGRLITCHSDPAVPKKSADILSNQVFRISW